MLSVDKTIAVDPVATVDPVALEKSISSATEALLGYRQSDGHWVFELEADSTIPSEYVLLRHYLAEPVDSVLEAKIANYLRRTQGDHGGWPLVQDGPFDMSASVKSYFALKMIGDSVDAPHMVRAREAIRSRGGAARVNVFTRFLLAFYGVLTWRAVPVLPIEIMLLPMWSPFHLNKISYWARTTIVPLMVMAALKPLAKNPKGVGIDELFLQDPKSVGMTAKAPHQSWGWFTLFSTLDKILRVDRAVVSEEAAPARDRRRARLHRGAAERRRRHGRDLSADGQHRHDVRGARQGTGFSAARGHPQGHRQAAGDRRARGLLPALRLAGVGHRADLPRAGGGRRRRHAREDEAGPRLAEAAAGARPQGRLGGEGPRCPSGRLGVPVQQRTIIPISTTPPWS